MNRNHRRRRWLCRIIVAMAALVLLMSAVSHAQLSLDQVVSQSQDASKKDKPKVSVPEPDTSVLLLLGIGVTGLVGYCVERRKRAA